MDGNRANWFLLGITFLETGAFLIAAVLCFRNWKSSQIVSGRSVWFVDWDWSAVLHLR